MTQSLSVHQSQGVRPKRAKCSQDIQRAADHCLSIPQTLARGTCALTDYGKDWLSINVLSITLSPSFLFYLSCSDHQINVAPEPRVVVSMELLSLHRLPSLRSWAMGALAVFHFMPIAIYTNQWPSTYSLGHMINQVSGH